MTDRETYYPLPVFLRLDGIPCLVVGGGAVAARKIGDLLESGARVTVIAEKPADPVRRFAGSRLVTLEKREFRPSDTAGYRVVFAATDDDAVNRTVYDDGRREGCLVNVVDDPAQCDFFSAAVVKRGPLRIAISTNGCCPAAAARIRRDLEQRYTTDYADFVEAAGVLRQRLIEHEARLPVDPERKRAALEWLAGDEAFAMFATHGSERLWKELTNIIST